MAGNTICALPNLKAEMARQGVSASQLGEIFATEDSAGKTAQSVYSWLRGESEPSLGDAFEVAHRLNSSVDYLFSSQPIIGGN